VGLTADEVHEAVLVDVAEVAGVVPKVAPGARRLVRLVQEPDHEGVRVRGPGDQLADRAGGNGPIPFVDDGHFAPSPWLAGRTRPPLVHAL
jgi:hypothetical protein